MAVQYIVGDSTPTSHAVCDREDSPARHAVRVEWFRAEPGGSAGFIATSPAFTTTAVSNPAPLQRPM